MGKIIYEGNWVSTYSYSGMIHLMQRLGGSEIKDHQGKYGKTLGHVWSMPDGTVVKSGITSIKNPFSPLVKVEIFGENQRAIQDLEGRLREKASIDAGFVPFGC